jgi:branched-chain amino acid transport system permease protein
MKFISSLFGRHKKIRLPLVVKEYQIKGWPLFVGIICDQSLDNLEGVVMQATTFAGQQEISSQDTQAIKDYIEIFSATVGLIDIYSFIFSIICITFLHLFLTYAKNGIAIKAGVNDPIAVSLMGVDFNNLIRNVFFLSGIFAGIAGVFMGMRYMVYPQMGWITNKAYIAAVIGGLGNLPGAIVGGLLLGVIESFVSVYISSVVRDVFSFGLLIIILLVKPLGLFGKKMEEKV